MRVHILSKETVFTSGLSAFIPRVFRADAGMSDAAGLRSERSARWTGRIYAIGGMLGISDIFLLPQGGARGYNKARDFRVGA